MLLKIRDTPLQLFWWNLSALAQRLGNKTATSTSLKTKYFYLKRIKSETTFFVTRKDTALTRFWCYCRFFSYNLQYFLSKNAAAGLDWGDRRLTVEEPTLALLPLKRQNGFCFKLSFGVYQPILLLHHLKLPFLSFCCFYCPFKPKQLVLFSSGRHSWR